jgi:Clp amino terminal domain, pathogenicity island component/ClpX C4-type zinc finger
VDVDETVFEQTLAARERLAELQEEAERGRTEFHQAVRRLHAAGASMRDVAEALGLSHQRVHQIVNGGGEMATPARRRTLLNRLVRRSRTTCEPGQKGTGPAGLTLDGFYVDAREAMSLAQEEARAFDHDYLGTEHVLLGLLRTEHGVAARLLSALGVDLERSRTAVRDLLGGATSVARAGQASSLRPTERLKKVLDLARQEAKGSRSTHVRSEHLLLGLAREGGGLGARILAQFGVGYHQLSGRVNRAALACSFCRRSGLDVFRLVAGPGVFICEHCSEGAGRLHDPDDVGEPPSQLKIVPGDQAASCSFCGKRRADVERLVAADSGVTICTACLVLCDEIQEAERDAFVPGQG